jgi:hypothetical protein
MITPRSGRTFYEALTKAKLTPPRSEAEVGLRFLDLMVVGCDHELVGSPTWYRRLIETAPDHLDHVVDIEADRLDREGDDV